MPLDVIGAGFGRTGTMSLKLALEELGFGPCYHMVEVLKAPGAAEHWAAAAESKAVDWDDMFGGYRSAVDWSTADYWRELADHYPNAKIVLTIRDPEDWFRSTQDTIFGPINTLMSDGSSAVSRVMRGISARHFGGRPNDRAACLAGYEAHNTAVRREVPSERLLVLDIAEGWDPLCRFLGALVPTMSFPRANSTAEFREHASAMMERTRVKST